MIDYLFIDVLLGCCVLVIVVLMIGVCLFRSMCLKIGYMLQIVTVVCSRASACFSAARAHTFWMTSEINKLKYAKACLNI